MAAMRRKRRPRIWEVVSNLLLWPLGVGMREKTCAMWGLQMCRLGCNKESKNGNQDNRWYNAEEPDKFNDLRSPSGHDIVEPHSSQ